uniref:C2H2-type domain-containing protein n=1 Tax=Gadus morhua TaxID=8049 RepID=A0A8C5A8I5_GADMO
MKIGIKLFDLPFFILVTDDSFQNIEPLHCNFLIQTKVSGAKPTAASLRPSLCNDVVGSKPSTASLHLSSCKDAGPVQNTGRGFECTLCFQIFWSREELRKHLPNHSQERFYCCGLCGKRFLTLDSLNMHRHKNEKTYPCKKCDMYHQPNLEKQSGLKPMTHGSRQTAKKSRCIGKYKCEDCGKKFGLISVYQRHLRYHKKEPTVNPNISFNNSPSLELHIKSRIMAGMPQTVQEKDNADIVNMDSSHTKNDLYECNECQQTFSNLKIFLTHQNSHNFKNSE